MEPLVAQTMVDSTAMIESRMMAMAVADYDTGRLATDRKLEDDQMAAAAAVKTDCQKEDTAATVREMFREKKAVDSDEIGSLPLQRMEGQAASNNQAHTIAVLLDHVTPPTS